MKFHALCLGMMVASCSVAGAQESPTPPAPRASVAAPGGGAGNATTAPGNTPPGKIARPNMPHKPGGGDDAGMPGKKIHGTGMIKSGEKKPEEAPAPEAPEAPLKGDVIFFKSGSKLAGVQVLHETPMSVEVQTTPNLPSLKINKKLVDHIDYDKNEPTPATPAAAPAPPAPDIFPGQELTPELHHKLSASLTDSPLKFENTDFIDIMQKLCSTAGVTLEVGPAVQKIAPVSRQWTVSIAPGTTLQLLLLDFMKTFPKVKVVQEYDKLRIMMNVPGAPVPATGGAAGGAAAGGASPTATPAEKSSVTASAPTAAKP